jgi:DNA-directed RNA polymerase specialized sigma24 family protein
MEDVRSLLGALPAHYRVPYEMFSFDGVSYEQISSRLRLPIRTVGTRINRARKLLRALLQEKELRNIDCERGANVRVNVG